MEAGITPSGTVLARLHRCRSTTSLLACAVACGALALGGCASSSGMGQALSRTLESVGLRDVDHDARAGIRSVSLRLHAGRNLNAAGDGRAAATVVRIYHLRATERFEQARFGSLMDEAGEQAALGSDLVQVREAVLTPGEKRESVERLSPETTHLGVVALFRDPAPGRWRFLFAVGPNGVEGERITLGLHACALSTGSPALATRVQGDPSSLAGLRCGG